jgi:hypothetical protein
MLAALRRYFTIGRVPVRVGHPYRDRQLSDAGYEPGPNPFAPRPRRPWHDLLREALAQGDGHWREIFRGPIRVHGVAVDRNGRVLGGHPPRPPRRPPGTPRPSRLIPLTNPSHTER